MNKYLMFIFGGIIGSLASAILAWINAEKISYRKLKLRERNRERGTPIIGLYKPHKKKIFSPREAAFIPESKTIYQYPRKVELKNMPGKETEPVFDECFYKYILMGKLTKAQAFYKALADYPTEIDLNGKKAFEEAMRRREKALTKKT